MATKSSVVLAILVTVTLSFVLLETLTRVVFSNRHFDKELLYSNGNMETFNEELGWALNPGVVQRIRTKHKQVVTYRTDSYGFRTSPIGTAQVPEDDLEAAVLFVGDSITFGTSSNTSYPAEFSRISGLRSINAGVPGYGTDQAFLMTRRILETYQVRPNLVVLGFYENDVQNNVSGRSIHAEEDAVIHKPLLDLDTNEYRKAERSKNDITVRYASPDVGQALLNLASQSKFLRAAGRILKYDVAPWIRGTTPFQFDSLAQRYLKGNLDHFVTYLRAHGIDFALLHVAAGRPDLEKQLQPYLRAYCQANDILYVRPELSAADIIPRDGHLSESGARRVAEALWKELRHRPRAGVPNADTSADGR